MRHLFVVSVLCTVISIPDPWRLTTIDVLVQIASVAPSISCEGPDIAVIVVRAILEAISVLWRIRGEEEGCVRSDGSNDSCSTNGSEGLIVFC
jgi:hypothetical protein